MRRFLLVMLLVVASGNAMADSCDEDTIKSVSSDGSILVMISGAVYEVDSVNRVDTQIWLPSDDVLICDDEIINKDENGEKASVKKLK